MRQVCNVTYAYATEWMSQKDRDQFDRELFADNPGSVSHGTKALSALMGGLRRPAAPPEREG